MSMLLAVDGRARGRAEGGRGRDRRGWGQRERGGLTDWYEQQPS